ncbi:c-type cytochrome [Desulfosudis oleivorans]|uniref:Cytochrome c class I n=1 Tax=Desulfosudis oleivorans (strain DSM 6200 / JCM 39069 / Hxd3) TaxID=96561 RepID=A8ZSU7_DESOH|nr:cytochrome c [Desulfosudis oleivorans]ABW66010.1 cytochrome c class I [Desulfosudis oleivorans Hxd3]
MNAKKTIQASFGIRVLFVVVSAALLIVTAWVIMGEKEDLQQWQQHQAAYNDQYAAMLAEKLAGAKAAEDEEAVKKWAKLKDGHDRSMDIKMRAVFLPDAQVRDLCQSCHMGMENSLFATAEHPLKAHSPEILADHKITRYGCSLCHHGQGAGLNPEKAHGFEENWEKPRIPLKYIESACFECHENVYGLKGAEKAAEGKTAFTEMGCYGCHDANVIEGLPKFSVPFSGMARKISSKKWVYKWIEDPQATRPGTLMPTFRMEPQELAGIVEYIWSLEDPDLRLPAFNTRSGSAKTGKAVFTDKGCIACHSPDRNKAGQSRRVPMLSDAGQKLTALWMAKWIEDPRSINPDTWMPKLDITPEDVKNLAVYLTTVKDGEVGTRLDFDMADGKKEDGKALVQARGCLGCHIVKGAEDPSKVGVSVADVADKRMEELPFGNSDVPFTKWDWLDNKIRKPDIYKTDDMPMYMPDYVMTDEEREHLVIFYLYNRLLDLPENYIVRASRQQVVNERGDWMIRHFNCKGCHEILDGEKPRIDTFIAKKSMVPPRIVNEAEKTQPTWLFNYLRRPSAMRPWLEMRMPEFNFTYDDVPMVIEHLHALMPEKSRRVSPIPYEPALVQTDYDEETIEMGKYRFRNDKCMQCHPVSFTGELPEGKQLEDLSINLMISKTRLRFEWIKNFMRDPNTYAGVGTKMPYVFYTPDKVPRIPDPEAWLDRTALFLMFMEEVPEAVQEEEKQREVEEFDFSNY